MPAPPIVERDRPRHRDVERLSASRRAGSSRSRAQAATTSSGRPSRSEPSTKRECDGSSSVSGGAPWATSATQPSGAKSAERHAEDRAGRGSQRLSARTGRRSRPTARGRRRTRRRPRAPACRRCRDPRRARARGPSGGSFRSGRAVRKTPITRGAWPSVETSASRCDETLLGPRQLERRRARRHPRARSRAPSRPRARPRPGPRPRHTNWPSLSRCRRVSSLRTSLQASGCRAELISLATGSNCRGSRSGAESARSPPGQRPTSSS